MMLVYIGNVFLTFTPPLNFKTNFFLIQKFIHNTVFPRIEARASIYFRALFDLASKQRVGLLRDRPLYKHVALAAASIEFFSTQFTVQSLKATS